MPTQNIFVRKISRVSKCPHINLPHSIVQKLGYSFDEYVTIKVNADQTLTLKKLDINSS